MQSVAAKEAKAYGFTIVVWTTGAFLLIERGAPTAGAVFLFMASVLAAQIVNVLIAFGSPARKWTSPSPVEYVWTTMHIGPTVLGVVVAWAVARGLDGMWAYAFTPAAAVLVYELLLGVESLVLAAGDHIDPASALPSDEGSDRSS
jgi:hypothetical protein